MAPQVIAAGAAVDSLTRDVRRLDPGPGDVAHLNRVVRTRFRTGNEDFERDDHLDKVVPKPWGYEYRAFVNDFFDFWALHIDAPHGTSMHVHPRKLTYLICLGGLGTTRSLTDELAVGPGSVVRIAPGAFHATRNVGDEPLELVEVEVPRNKLDLIRLQDDYNRAGTAYESQYVEHPQHAMHPVRQLPNTRMRDGTPDGRFRFELRTGMDIFYRRRSQDVFYVPLCMSGVVRSEVDILTGDSGRRPQTDQTYLCIARAA